MYVFIPRGITREKGFVTARTLYPHWSPTVRADDGQQVLVVEETMITDDKY